MSNIDTHMPLIDKLLFQYEDHIAGNGEFHFKSEKVVKLFILSKREKQKLQE